MSSKPKKESSKALSMFDLYRDMGNNRSTAKLQQELGRPKSYKRQLDEWSRLHNWVARAKTHDQAISDAAAEADKQARIEEKEKLRTERLQDDRLIRQVAREVLVDRATRKVKRVVGTRGDRLAKDEITARMFEVAVSGLRTAGDEERKDTGEATNRLELSGPGGAPIPMSGEHRVDLSGYTNDELRDFITRTGGSGEGGARVPQSP